jgi:hypothetical protein
MRHLRHRQHQPQHQQLLPVFLVRATTRLQQARAWESHVRWLAQRATTHSLQAVVQGSVLVVHVRLALAAQVVQAVLHVRVAHLVQASAEVTPVAHLVQVLVAVLLVLVVALASVDHVRLVALVVAVAATVVAPLVRSVRVEAVVLPRLASRSVRNAKSSNREWLQALVAQLCHAAMEPPCYVYVAVPAFRTSLTRLKPLRLS